MVVGAIYVTSHTVPLLLSVSLIILRKSAFRLYLKSLNLNQQLSQNFRSISNLTFILILPVIDENTIFDKFQSGFQKCHSSEIALIRVRNVLLSADTVDFFSFILLLLSLSAAFDSIDHNILINRLTVCVGISGTALKWFESYLSDRQFSVSMRNCFIFICLTDIWGSTGIYSCPHFDFLLCASMRKRY